MRSAPVPSSIVALALSLVGTLAVAETPPPAPVESAPPPAAPAPPAQLPPAPPPAAAPQAPLMAPPPPAVAPTPPPVPATDEAGPLSLKIGSASLTPLGFVDFTGVFRSSAVGSGIGTNFGSIPYGTVYGSKLTETRLSVQNSRLGFRLDAPVLGSHVIGYMESDFLGAAPGNVAVSSNSNTLRSRLYWVDLRKGDWEVLGGQTWSLITPNRVGLSPLPADVFNTLDMDVNYQAGLVWGRIPELRVVYHPSDMFAAAVALDSPEQYIGGSAGGGTVTLPMGLAMSLPNMQLNAGNSTFTVPNVAPDVIVKAAFDVPSRFHVELGGVERQFKIWNPLSDQTFSATGVGGFLNFNAQLFEGFRLIGNAFVSSGGGRYIFGQAPDVVVRADGSLSTVKSSSTVDGVELTLGSTQLYAYYGGIYIAHNTSPAADGTPCTDAMSCVGYGYQGSPNGQNKWIQEGSGGFIQTFWKAPKYGALSAIGQYSYLSRAPWYVAAGAPSNAHTNMVFLDLRYTLPGAPPRR